MGLLDDAIREHLELKRRHGADPAEVERLEHEALGPARREPALAPEEPADFYNDEAEDELGPEEDEPSGAVAAESTPAAEPEAPVAPPAPAAPDADEPDDEPDVVPGEHDELEETPEFLQETPEHDRLWFEQKPPRDFDF